MDSCPETCLEQQACLSLLTFAWIGSLTIVFDRNPESTNQLMRIIDFIVGAPISLDEIVVCTLG